MRSNEHNDARSRKYKCIIAPSHSTFTISHRDIAISHCVYAAYNINKPSIKERLRIRLTHEQNDLSFLEMVPSAFAFHTWADAYTRMDHG
jgi:hypothetical protein